MDFSKLTEDLWKLFFSKSSEINVDTVLEWCAPDCVIIGTGAQEFYMGLEGFLQSFSDEMADRNDVEFHFKNIWCKEMPLNEDSILVYGKFCVIGESIDNSVHIHMDSRFSAIYKNMGDKWQLVHIHQSVPNVDQGEGEYYPKTLMKRVQELQCVNEEMTELAQKDGLTGLDNFRAFCCQWENRKSERGWFFVLDLDHFKEVNDTYGHLKGNEVLVSMGRVFYSNLRENDLLCRMGGDEFLIYCGEMKDKESADDFIQRLQYDLKAVGLTTPYWTTVSIGATEVFPNMTIDEAIENADKALYTVKKTKKGSYFIS